MNKKIVLLLIIFLVLPIVYSITTFVVQETDKLSLRTDATDPDSDKLTYYYASPLNEKGEWQTTYGDEGTYSSAITVSDGQANTTEDIKIIVNKKEVAPIIDYASPNDPATINEPESVNFEVQASDLNKDTLTYTWYLDNRRAGSGQYFTYSTNYDDAGIHRVLIIVSDGTLDASKEWTVNVLNFDVGMLLNQINDVTVNEGEIARLNLLDFAKYGLSYTISEPLGNKNEWPTTYGDSGEYAVFIHAVGNGFKGDKTVTVTVKDADRTPVFDGVGNKLIDENQTVAIILNAVDPDGDAIAYSLDKLPEGAALDGNKFTWTPGFNTVKKEDFIDKIVDKFTVLSNNFYLQFAAASKDSKVVQNVIITVKDVNRPPVLEDMQPITVNEGDTIKIAPSAYDLDGDKVALSYSGFMASDTYKTKFGDAGAKYVKITAGDGALAVSKTVQITINHVNRPPTLDKISDIKASEGDHIEMVLNAHDPDGDQLQYSVSNAPSQASLSGNKFIWDVPYDFAGKKEIKMLDLVFYVSDGNLSASQPARVQVTGKNRAPRIINASRSIVAKVNEPVFMFVKAVDDDNDQLTYTWDFGILEKYRATENHERIFTSSGNKVVKVIVSDGTDSIEQIINIFVQDGSNYNSQFLNESVYIKVRKVNITYKETRILSAQNVQSLTTSGGIASSAANRPPRILESTNNVVAKIGQPVLLYIKAVDDDNDRLTYTWDFGFMDSHKGQYQQRTFATAGNKAVKVTVSDGHYNVAQALNVNVVE